MSVMLVWKLWILLSRTTGKLGKSIQTAACNGLLWSGYGSRLTFMPTAVVTELVVLHFLGKR
jgi:hypothetical protein